MDSTGRENIEITESIAIIRGLLGKGIQLYGPFKTLKEAFEYCEKNFPDDTREYIPMYKEVVTSGESRE
jgi:hypothetical protein